ncbi:hypothetical protein R3P38DRAFT_2784450 [Favolaschia claudopus]|uniref:Uncharacterized protein n=1 Tax=Favolaschia claudopus TaxID=2862362 RepID=A0AAW0AWG9_9AGAR
MAKDRKRRKLAESNASALKKPGNPGDFKGVQRCCCQELGNDKYHTKQLAVQQNALQRSASQQTLWLKYQKWDLLCPYNKLIRSRVAGIAREITGHLPLQNLRFNPCRMGKAQFPCLPLTLLLLLFWSLSPAGVLPNAPVKTQQGVGGDKEQNAQSQLDLVYII